MSDDTKSDAGAVEAGLKDAKPAPPRRQRKAKAPPPYVDPLTVTPPQIDDLPRLMEGHPTKVPPGWEG